jgi:hypothetical protein
MLVERIAAGSLMLNFSGAWCFDSPGEVRSGVVSAFSELIGRIVAQGHRQELLERKRRTFLASLKVGTSKVQLERERSLRSALRPEAHKLFFDRF